MKKYLSLLLLTVVLSATYFNNSDWSREYQLISNCEIGVVVQHHPDKICFMGNGILSEKECFYYDVTFTMTTPAKDNKPRCHSEIYLDIDVTQDEFEQEIQDAGFKILSSQAI